MWVGVTQPGSSNSSGSSGSRSGSRSGGRHLQLTREVAQDWRAQAAAAETQGSAAVVAPMPGKIVKVHTEGNGSNAGSNEVKWGQMQGQMGSCGVNCRVKWGHMGSSGGFPPH